ncbi:MAG: mandelate racemase, partial [Rhizobiales bacterium]|nr:mandelate racemase [Hyphomicrobiales bacterium]
ARGACVDVFSIKLSKNGGILPSRKIAELAEAHGLKILINSMIEFGVSQAAALQLGVTLPNLLEAGHAYMSAHRMVDDPTDFAANVKGGMARVSERPGLGVSIDTEKLARITTEACTIDESGLREGLAA